MSNNKFKKILIIAAVLVVVVGFIKERFQNSAPTKSGSTTKNSVVANDLVGKSAPNFKLVDRQGKEYTNENLKGKKVVLFFNEGLACYPACWEQMKKLSSDERLNTDDIVALSVVTDSKGSWQSAAEQTSELASIKVALDEDVSVSKAFGMTTLPSSMHSGIPGHTYVIIDKDGVVRYLLDDPRMGVNNDKILSEINKLK